MDGVTISRLMDAVRAGDLETVRFMIDARPELVNLDTAANDEHRALHHAVLRRQPEMVRFLCSAVPIHERASIRTATQRAR